MANTLFFFHGYMLLSLRFSFNCIFFERDYRQKPLHLLLKERDRSEATWRPPPELRGEQGPDGPAPLTIELYVRYKLPICFRSFPKRLHYMPSILLEVISYSFIASVFQLYLKFVFVFLLSPQAYRRPLWYL